LIVQRSGSNCGRDVPDPSFILYAPFGGESEGGGSFLGDRNPAAARNTTVSLVAERRTSRSGFSPFSAAVARCARGRAPPGIPIDARRRFFVWVETRKAVRRANGATGSQAAKALRASPLPRFPARCTRRPPGPGRSEGGSEP